jgi:hypothetical protein
MFHSFFKMTQQKVGHPQFKHDCLNKTTQNLMRTDSAILYRTKQHESFILKLKSDERELTKIDWNCIKQKWN